MHSDLQPGRTRLVTTVMTTFTVRLGGIQRGIDYWQQCLGRSPCAGCEMQDLAATYDTCITFVMMQLTELQVQLAIMAGYLIAAQWAMQIPMLCWRGPIDGQCCTLFGCHV